MQLPAEDPSWFTARHAKERDRIRELLAQLVAPHAERWEAQRFIDRPGWRAMAEAGLFGLPHDGEDFLLSALLLEELGRLGYAGVRAAIGVHAYMASSYLARFASPELAAAELPAIRAGQRVAALALSEQDAGSDLSRLATRAMPGTDASTGSDAAGGQGAVRGQGTAGGQDPGKGTKDAADRGDGNPAADADADLRVHGRKLHVANGSQAGCFITLVRTGEPRPGAAPRGLAGMSLLLIDAEAPGVTRTPEPMLGWRAADVCQVEFADVRVSRERMIGKPGKALIYLVQALDFERLVAGLLALGGAAHTLRLIDARIRKHRVHDVPLSGHQAVRHRVADLQAELATVRQFGYHAAWLHSRGRLDTRTASVLKLKATELEREAAHACAQLHGASGYLEETVPARLYRDAMAGTIAAGASELMRDLIFEA